MNTMADGAAQRLVAQIGEALFGQPGLTLMELAEKVKALRDTQGDQRAEFEAYRGGDFERDAQGYYVNCRTAQDWHMWQAAAKPSPGGQEVRAQFEAWAHAQSYRGGNIITDRDADHPDVYSCPNAQLTWQCWKAALATRQPVGQEPVASTDSDLLAELDEAAEHGATLSLGYLRELCKRSALALRTAAPVATAHAQNLQDGLDAAERIIDRMRKEGCPPAQAVDLAKLRDLASEMDRFRTKWKTASIAEFNHYADRLLALIDSKVVGK